MKLVASACVFAGLAACMAHMVALPNTSSPAPYNLRLQPSSQLESSSAIAASIYRSETSSSTSSSSSSSSPGHSAENSVYTTTLSHSSTSAVSGADDVSTPLLPPFESEDSEYISSMTQKPGTAEGTFRENNNQNSVRQITEVSITPAAGAIPENVSVVSADSKLSSSWSDEAEINDTISQEESSITSAVASMESAARPSDRDGTPFFHTTSFTTTFSSDVSFSASSDDGTQTDPSLLPSETTDFSASWRGVTEIESLHFGSTEDLPQATVQSLDVSSEDDFASGLEPSHVIHFSSSTETLTESSVHRTAVLPQVSDSAHSISSSLNLSDFSSSFSSEAGQTYNTVLPSQTILNRFHNSSGDTFTHPSSTLTILPSSTLASIPTSAQTTSPTLSTVIVEVIPTQTPPMGNTTTPPTTTSTTTQPPVRDVRYLFTLSGDCHLILNNTEFFQRFLAGFHDLIVKQLGIAEDSYRLGEISCGTVHVYVTFLHVTMPQFDIRLQSIIRNGGPGLSVPVWIDSHFATFDLTHAKHVPLVPDEHTFNIVAEVMDDVDIIVIIVACCICGVLIAIGLAICIKECYRRKHASSFNLLDVPHVDLKLEDFTLTRIPRPRTIYKEGSSKTKRGGADRSVVYADLATEPSNNGHAANSNVLHPSDMHLRIREHSDGITVGVTASMGSAHSSYSGHSTRNSYEDRSTSRTSKRRARIRTPSVDDMSESECPASERLLAGHQQGELGGAQNPVFVDEEEEKEKLHTGCEGAL